jgi:hypothetical protein
VGSSPLNATNLFGGTTAITGLIAAATGLLAYRASKHQAPPIVYVMAAPGQAAPAGAVPVAELYKPQAEAADPAGAAEKAGAAADPKEVDKTAEDDQAP